MSSIATRHIYSARQYQEDAVNNTLKWIKGHPGQRPICVLPTGAGKSFVIGMCTAAVYEEFEYLNPRAIITVPSKELCIQNAEKVAQLAPSNVSVDVYSASVGRRNAQADIVVATIGSIVGNEHELGYRGQWWNDECHRVSPDGLGEYWQFARNLAKNGNYISAGFTATPYRGNGIWLTHGKQPLYSGICHNTTMGELLDLGFLAKLVVPFNKIKTRIDTSKVKMSGGDFNIKELSEVTAKYLLNAAHETIFLASERKKWVAFLPNVQTANDFCKILNSLGVPSAVVVGETKDTKEDPERARLINDFSLGRFRCLITVVALTTGYDEPGIDCLIWLRDTKSPVLYVQGAGRGTRPAPGKVDCLWLDYTDTTERLGPVDKVKGKPPKKKRDSEAPCIICPECGNKWIPASTIICAQYYKDGNGNNVLDQDGNPVREFGCGAIMREVEEWKEQGASTAIAMAAGNNEHVYNIDRITCEQKSDRKGKNYLQINFRGIMGSVCKVNLFYGYIGFTPDSLPVWLELTGDHATGYNNSYTCHKYINDCLSVNKTLGIKSIKINIESKPFRLVEVYR